MLPREIFPCSASRNASICGQGVEATGLDLDVFGRRFRLRGRANQWSRPSIVIPETLSCGAIVGVGVAVLLFVQRQFNKSQWESMIAGQASARRALDSMKESLETEMAVVQSMRMPNEFSPP